MNHGINSQLTDCLSKHFEILSLAGSGASGDVYHARSRGDQREVALKVLKRQTPRTLYRFKKEFRALSELEHPNLVTLYELHNEANEWFLSMEWVEGCSIKEYLARSSHPDLMDYWRLRRSISQVCEGLAELHGAGFLHRDIKPSNLIVNRKEQVKLLDFGVVTEIFPTNLRQSVEMVGSPMYMSPEQARGLPIGPASDLYSLGVMLYELLTNTMPYSGGLADVLLQKESPVAAEPAAIATSTPTDLNALCVSLLQPEPAARPSVEEVYRVLRGKRTFVGASSTSHHRLLVGRDAALATLQKQFESVLRGGVDTVVVHGESGMGKTTLVRSFLERAAADTPELVVLQGKCYQRESVPFKALDSLLDDLSRYILRLKPVEISDLLPDNTSALVRLFPVLGRIPAVSEAARGLYRFRDALDIRALGASALAELFGNLTERHPVVVFIDDLQWGDIDSVSLLNEIMNDPRCSRLLLIVSHRDGPEYDRQLLESLSPALANHQQGAGKATIKVGPLALRDRFTLARALAREIKLDEFQMHLVANKSEGNPFLLEQLVLQRQKVGDLALETVESPTGGDVAVLLGIRLAELSYLSRQLFDLVAVAGQPVDRVVAYDAARIGATNRQPLATLLNARLIKVSRDGPGRELLDTAHDQLREHVFDALDEAEIALLRQKLLDSMARNGVNDPHTMARYSLDLGDQSAALRYTLLAARQAVEQFAFHRAELLYMQVLSLTDDPEVIKSTLLGLAETLVYLGRGAEAAQVYLDAAKHARGERLELLLRAAGQYLRSGRIDSGLETFGLVAREAGLPFRRSSSSALVWLLAQRARLRLRGIGFTPRRAQELSSTVRLQIETSWTAAVGLSIVDTVRGADYQARNLLQSLASGEPYRISRALAMEAAFVATGGIRNQRRAEQLLQKAQILAEGVEHPHAVGLVSVTRGFAQFLFGNWRESIVWCEKGADYLTRYWRSAHWETDSTKTFILHALYHLGDLQGMRQRLSECIRRAAERDDRYSLTSFRTFFSMMLHLAADDATAGGEMADQAINSWSKRDFHVQHYFHLLALGNQALYRGVEAADLEWLASRWKPLARSQLMRVQTVRTDALQLRARMALAMAVRGDDRSMLKRARRDCRRLSRENASWVKPYALLLQAALDWQSGKTQRAIETLVSAENRFEAQGMSLYATAARARRGQLVGLGTATELYHTALTRLEQQEIVDPTRFLDMLAPGFNQVS